MEINELKEAVKAFSELEEAINSGEFKVEDVKEILDVAIETTFEALDTVKKLTLGEETDVSEAEALIILEEIKDKVKKFDKKEYKRDIFLVLELASISDKNINGELFVPFIIDILLGSAEVMVQYKPKILKRTKKYISEFKKTNRKEL